MGEASGCYAGSMLERSQRGKKDEKPAKRG